MEEIKDDMFLGASPLIFKRAEELRTKMTKAELILWNVLKKKRLNGYKFRRQHPILRYVLDFYCHQKKLGVELDGKIHNNQKLYDGDRTNNLKFYDVKTIRFTNEEIFNNLEEVKSKILLELNNRNIE